MIFHQQQIPINQTNRSQIFNACATDSASNIVDEKFISEKFFNCQHATSQNPKYLVKDYLVKD